MNRYLTIHIPEAAVPMPISRFLRTQAGLTKNADQPGKVPSRWYPEKRTAVPGNGNNLPRGSDHSMPGNGRCGFCPAGIYDFHCQFRPSQILFPSFYRLNLLFIF